MPFLLYLSFFYGKCLQQPLILLQPGQRGDLLPSTRHDQPPGHHGHDNGDSLRTPDGHADNHDLAGPVALLVTAGDAAGHPPRIQLPERGRGQSLESQLPAVQRGPQGRSSASSSSSSSSSCSLSLHLQPRQEARGGPQRVSIKQ